MEYERKFTLTSAHFNNETTYNDFKNAVEDSDKSTNHVQSLKAFALLLKGVLPNIHGHNFVIVVTLTSGPGWAWSTTSDYLADDEVIEKCVRQWDRCNLSVHPDFHDARATTEMMALKLKKKLERLIDDCKISVSVQETDEIKASA